MGLFVLPSILYARCFLSMVFQFPLPDSEWLLRSWLGFGCAHHPYAVRVGGSGDKKEIANGITVVVSLKYLESPKMMILFNKWALKKDYVGRVVPVMPVMFVEVYSHCF